MKIHPSELPNKNPKRSSFSFCRMSFWVKGSGEQSFVYRINRIVAGKEFYVSVPFRLNESRSSIARGLKTSRMMLKHHITEQTA